MLTFLAMYRHRHLRHGLTSQNTSRTHSKPIFLACAICGPGFAVVPPTSSRLRRFGGSIRQSVSILTPTRLISSTHTNSSHLHHSLHTHTHSPHSPHSTPLHSTSLHYMPANPPPPAPACRPPAVLSPTHTFTLTHVHYRASARFKN